MPDVSFTARWGRSAVPLGLIPLAILAFIPLEAEGTVALSLLLLISGLALLGVSPRNRVPAMLIAVTASLRYLWWRGTETLYLSEFPDAVASVLLLVTELYGFLILAGGCFQTAIRRERTPVSIDLMDPYLPTVDVFIPTYNEGCDILRRTLTCATALDYPRYAVHVLDDGRRPEVQALARELGCNYLSRPDNKGAKAGNLNHALARTTGELVAIFDADHVPVRTFLQATVGFCVEDPQVALVQTPHHFYNPDPFERNLFLEGRSPPEQTFFYHMVQKGNDFWNSAFFCGSCALLRRSALESVGGIAVETVTEDAHTALKLHAGGWRSVYLDMPQAAGLATERFAYHIQQRIRWTRGMVQILRLDNPLLKDGLTLAQRVSYFIAASHFLFGLPRVIYLLAPASYLLLGLHPVLASAAEILTYVTPHLVLGAACASAANRNTRHSFWPEVHETAVAPWTAVVAVATWIAPRHGRFNVTPKGSAPDRFEFDWRHAWPLLALLGVSLLALFAAPLRLAEEPQAWDTVLLAVLWTLFNLAMLLAATMVCQERPERRLRSRVPATALVRVRAASARSTDGPVFQAAGDLRDLSELGATLVLDREPPPDVPLDVEIRGPSGAVSRVGAYARLAGLAEDGRVVAGVRFEAVTRDTLGALLRLMFSEPDRWLNDHFRADGAIRSAFAVLAAPWRAIWCRYARPAGRRAQRGAGSVIGEGWEIAECEACGARTLPAVGACPRCAATLPSFVEPPSSESGRPGRRVALGLIAAAFTGFVLLPTAPRPAAVVAARLGLTAASVPPGLSGLDSMRRELQFLYWEARGMSLWIGSPMTARWEKRLWAVHYSLSQPELEASAPATIALIRALQAAQIGLRGVASDMRLGGRSEAVRARLRDVDLELSHARTGLRLSN